MRGRLLQALTFGLSHVPDARASGDSVTGTILVTAAAGWVFGWLRDRSGSLAAPMLAHVAVNEAGKIAALAIQHPPSMVRRVVLQPDWLSHRGHRGAACRVV
jgi:CAAX protease family protein